MLDHLVYAVPDVEAASADLAERLGVAPQEGGRFQGRGVYNHLLALGNDAYLEVIGPDPEQPDHGGPMPFGLTREAGPRLVHWCAKAGPELDERVAAANEAGIALGDVRPLARTLPDGTRLEWRLSIGAWPPPFQGLVPFLIDWGQARHPSTTAPQGCRLASFHAEHPDADAVAAALRLVGVNLDVRPAARPALVVVIEAAGRRVELRGAAAE